MEGFNLFRLSVIDLQMLSKFEKERTSKKKILMFTLKLKKYNIRPRGGKLVVNKRSEIKF